MDLDTEITKIFCLDPRRSLLLFSLSSPMKQELSEKLLEDHRKNPKNFKKMIARTALLLGIGNTGGRGEGAWADTIADMLNGRFSPKRPSKKADADKRFKWETTPVDLSQPGFGKFREVAAVSRSGSTKKIDDPEWDQDGEKGRRVYDEFLVPYSDLPPVLFNSQRAQGTANSPYRQLSNFYGGVENCFMRDRFPQEKLQKLFDEFIECDEKRFVELLKILQPGKKDWTKRKEEYWLNRNLDDVCIRGIVSKLTGSIVKDSSAYRRREGAIAKYLGLESIEKKGVLTADERDGLMLRCLRFKYSQENYRKLLLSTAQEGRPNPLHETPLKGRPGEWTWKEGEGGDLLGKLLYQVRDELFLNSDYPYSSKMSRGFYSTDYSCGRDSIILVCPVLQDGKDFTTMKEFLTNATEERQRDFWRAVGKNILLALWKWGEAHVSTHGLGVAYLHVRVERVPKHFWCLRRKKKEACATGKAEDWSCDAI